MRVQSAAGLSGRRCVRTALASLAITLAMAGGPRAVLAETVLITGANSGIGLEFAKQYAAKGWTTIATHRRREIPETLAELVAEYPNVRIEALDVTSVEEAKALAERLAETPIDVLIKNAGVYNDRSNCDRTDLECPGDWTNQTFGRFDYDLLDTIMAVNIKGPLIVSEALYENV